MYVHVHNNYASITVQWWYSDMWGREYCNKQLISEGVPLSTTLFIGNNLTP